MSPPSSSGGPAERPGRPPRTDLAAIVRVAGALVEDEGIGALTMRRLARELGVGPMTLYHHVRDRDDLLLRLLEASIADVPLPEPVADPIDRVVQYAAFVRRLVDERAWVLEVIAAGDRFAPRALLAGEVIAGAFAELGLDAAAAVDAYRSVWFLVLGELTHRHARERRIARGELSSFGATTFGALDADEVPHLAAGYAAGAGGRPADPDAAVRALAVGIIGAARA